MYFMNEDRAKELLKAEALKRGKAEAYILVLEHSLAVKKVADVFAHDLVEKGYEVDTKLVSIGALLHDIGRFTCEPKTKESIKHGIEGARILRELGFERLARVAERHIGAGITTKDIKEQGLELPEEDFVPVTIEEKIIAHADNLVFGSRIGKFEEVVERYKKELGEQYVKRLIKLKEDVEDARPKKIKTGTTETG